MSSYFYEANHVAQVLASIPNGILRRYPWLESLMAAFGTACQCLEDDMLDLIVSSAFDVAVDKTLDSFGDMIGVPRRGLSDDEYREVLRWRAQCKKSRGIRADVLKIQQLPGITVNYDESYPAAIELEMTFDDSPTEGSGIIQHIADGLEDCVAMGVGLRAVEDGEEFFRLDDADHGLDQGLLSRRIV